jgi:membrane protein DedA with SNARE-associated domain
MSGIELYDQLHGSKELAALPALVMSASLPRQELAKRHVVGIEKPFAFVLLLLAVLVGSSTLYALSARYGQRIVLHFGNYLHVDAHKLLTVEEKFQQDGPWVIILGRHIPGFRIPITIFAGMSGIA